MRIAVLTHTFPGLSQTFIVNQVTGLLDLGHDVVVYPSRRAHEAQGLRDVGEYRLTQRIHAPAPSGGRLQRLAAAGQAFVRHLPTHPKPLLQAIDPRRSGLGAVSGKAVLDAAFWLSQSFSPDIVLCHFGPSGLRGLSLRERGLLGGKLVTAFHAYDLTRFPRQHGRNVYAPLFQHGDLFLPITRYAAQKLLALGCRKERMVMHPMGVDCSRFAPGPGESSSGVLRVLSVGRLVEKKGFDDALRAVARARAEGLAIQYTVIGDGELRDALHGLHAQLALGDWVQFMGAQGSDEVRRQLANCDALLAPSVTASDGDEEGLPVVLMEAMAMGKAVVSTRHAAIPELVTDGQHGLLVAERRPDQLYAALRRLHDDRALLATLGQAGRARALSDFNVTTLNRRLEGLFQQLLDGTHPH